jgi:hypothetical protein
MDASNTIPYMTFLVVVEPEVISKDPKMRIYERRGHPCFRGTTGACVPLEIRTLVTGLFSREGIGGFCSLVLIYSHP